ncbi:syntaxin-17 isoform X2 [Narcine bancroftii]|uniref:syntaxin-17 isoform X2 n=1 Tax=Narcine bancroftii TaxID=1343680 RepID=UPI003831A301
MAEGPAKLRYRRLESAIQKFVKVAIPTDLERLQKHQINIEKYHRCNQWNKLHQEHINASRTVQMLPDLLSFCSQTTHQSQNTPPLHNGFLLLKHIYGTIFLKQLRANMREMETICLRVTDEDSQALEKIINPVKEQAAVALEKFLKLHLQFSEVPNDHGNIVISQDRNSSLVQSQSIEGTFTDSQDSGSTLPQHSVRGDLLLPQIPQDHDAAESWKNLEENLIDLNNLVTEFSQLLHTQKEKIDSIEDHVSTAAENVEEGTKNLGKAAKYKLAMLPVAGALIGGVIGGPIGLLAGFKVAGAAAAIGGGILGFTGGRMLLKKHQQKIDEELSLSSSCPEKEDSDRKKSN